MKMKAFLILILVISSFANETKKGILMDSSYSTINKINWNFVFENDIEFLMLIINRMANLPSFVLRKYYDYDTKFIQYYNEASSFKISELKKGAVWINYAENLEEVKQAAEDCVKKIGKRRFEYPIFYYINDYLYNKGKEIVNQASKTFCDILKKNQLYCGIYAYKDKLEKYFDDEIKNNYPIWALDLPVTNVPYQGTWGIREYTQNGRLQGLAKRARLSESRIDYFSIIKEGHYNGY